MDALAGADDLALRAGPAGGDRGRHGRRLRPGHRPAGVPEPAHLGRARQRHRQPHQRPGQGHAAGGHRRPAGLRATSTTDPLLAGDLVGLAAAGQPKWAHEVRTPRGARHDHAPGLPRRRGAAGRARVRVAAAWTSSTQRGRRAGAAAVRRSTRAGAPAALDGAGRPAHRASPSGKVAIVAGDEVAQRGRASTPLVALAEALGAPVYGAPLHSTAASSPRPTRCAPGMLAPAAAGHPPRPCAGYERVLLIGGHALHGVSVHPRRRRCPTGIELLHLSPDPGAARAHLPDAPRRSLGDPQATLEALRPARGGPGRRRAPPPTPSTARRTRRAAERDRALEQTARSTLRRRADGADGRGPRAGAGRCRPTPRSSTRPSPPASTCAASTTGPSPGRYFFCKGGGLGWGMPAALGVSLGHDGEPVLCVVGDGVGHVLAAGAVDRGARAAAGRLRRREQPPVPDPQEQPARHGPRRVGHERHSWRWTSTTPPVDFVGLAASMGVDATLRRAGRRRRRRGRGCARRRAARTCSRSPSPRRREPASAAAAVACEASASSATAGPSSTAIDWDVRRRRALGRARARTARARRRWCASRRCTCIPSTRRGARCSASGSGASTSAAAHRASGSRSASMRRPCCGRR